jgi:hypothetical protein
MDFTQQYSLLMLVFLLTHRPAALSIFFFKNCCLQRLQLIQFHDEINLSHALILVTKTFLTLKFISAYKKFFPHR